MGPKFFRERRALILIFTSFALLITTEFDGAAQASQSSNSFRIIPLPANDLVYCPSDGYLYASVPAGTNSRAQTVCQINPETGELGVALNVGRDPGKLALSDDGRYLYVITDTNKIAKIDLTTKTKILAIDLGGPVTGMFKAYDLAVMPGYPDTVAVSCSIPPYSSETRVYDGQKLRAATGPWMSTLAFGTNASILYGFNAVSDRTFCRMVVNTNGASLEACQSPVALTADIIQSGGLIFSGSRGIYDPLTFSLSSPFESSGSAPSGSFGIDAPAGLAFYGLLSGVIRVYSLATFLPVGDIEVGAFGAPAGKIVRWGSNGLAYRVRTNWLVVGKSPLIPVAPATDLAVSLEAISTNALPNSQNEIRCNIFNQGSNDAQGITLVISVSAPGAITSALLPNGSCQNNGTIATCSIGSLPAHSTNSAQVQLFLAGTNGVRITAVLSSENVEASPENNTAMLWLAPSSPLDTRDGMSLHVVDMASDPLGHGIYLALGDSLPNWGNSIVQFNPLTGHFGKAIYVGPKLRTLSVSREGSTIYAGSSGTITRIDATSRQITLRIALTNSAYMPVSIAISPPDSNVFAVWLQDAPNRSGIRPGVGFNVYQNRELIAATNLPGNVYRMFISEDGSRVGAFRGAGGFTGNFLAAQFDLTSTGLQNPVTREEPFLSDADEGVKSAADAAYSGSGWVYDPANSRVLGSFNIPGVGGWPSSSAGSPIVEPDLLNGRVYFMRYAGGGRIYLHAFDPSRYRLIDSIILSGIELGPSRLLRWGQDGFAFLDDYGSPQTILHFLRSHLVPNAPGSDLALHLEGGANPGKVGQQEHYSLSITNQGSAPVDHARISLSYSVTGLVSDLHADTGFVSSNSAGIGWDVGRMQPGDRFTLDCRFTPMAGPLLKVIATIQDGGVDAIPSNDTAIHLELISQTPKQDMIA
ncbi:MAG TPA: hypothetical protein VMZ27_00770, partial [Candidatus Saccharimonadales bacterium]|nr:hypothetical protein [Candidatus Saccharimonadales bacterium]